MGVEGWEWRDESGEMGVQGWEWEWRDGSGGMRRSGSVV